MRLTDLTLMEQLRITPLALTRRKEHIRLTAEDGQVLQKLKPVVAAVVDEIVSEFYEVLLAQDEIARLIGDSESMQRLKRHLRKYILDIFDGCYDNEYVHSRLRVGMVHKRIGVAPQFYVGALELLRSILQRKIFEASDSDCDACQKSLGALSRILMLDLTLVFDMYIHSLMDEVTRSKDDVEKYAGNLRQQVAEQTQQLSELARRDGMTSLLNQRSFYEELRRELARSQRRGLALTLLYFDLDGFKKLNDTQGHQRGDEVLKAVTGCLDAVVRASDVPARYGGDEFCVILPETTTKQAEEVCARLRKVMTAAFKNVGVTCSMGLATTGPETFLDSDSLVKAADTAMYQAKKIKGYAVCIAKEKPARPPRSPQQARSTHKAGKPA